ncbi:hypothetical protein KCU91_g8037, partial [Aureobasidium melanogenum]
MLSFLNLPPEIRSAIYDVLLKSLLTNRTRILYTGNNPLRCKDSPDSVRRTLYYYTQQNGSQISFYGDKTFGTWDIIKARYNIHLADIDDLLFLASTCRLLRTEILARVWSNADILVRSPRPSVDLYWIFHSRLSSITCSFIRTLQIQVDHGKWSPREMKMTARFIRRRLPQLEQLTVKMPVKVPHWRKEANARKVALAELRSLPLQVTVKLDYYIAPGWYNIFMKRRTPDDLLDFQSKWNETAEARLHDLRVEFNLAGQKRREEQAKKKLRDQLSDSLEATLAIRSLMSG